MLSHWGRNRKRGPGLPLPQLLKMQTSETADFFGFKDRGRLRLGLRADVNIIACGRERSSATTFDRGVNAAGNLVNIG